MRRFSLMILALAVFFGVIIGRNHTEPGSTDRRAPANSKGAEPAATPQAAANAPAVDHPGHNITAEQAEADGAVLKTSSVVAKAPGAPVQAERAPARTEPSGFITSAPAHVSASAKSGGVDPSLEGLDLGDLTSAVQSELKRLGCYEARIDGQWGRKSEAALKAFAQRAGGAWGDASRRDLVVALRNYPAAFCGSECAANPAASQCTVAVTPKAKEGGEAGKDTSYLPPWMRDSKLSNAEQPQAVPPDQKVLSDTAPLDPKPKKSKNARRRGGDDRRVVQRYERRRQGNMDWLPQGWPGKR